MSKQQYNKDYSEDVLDILEHIEELKISGKHKESISEAEKLLCDDPNCVPALEEVADNYVSINKFERAEKACDRVLSLDNNSHIAYYILGFIRSNEQKWTEAVKYLKLANDLHSNNPEILRCLGWVLFNSGKQTQGVVILERSLNIDPENSLTLCDLGVCYLQSKSFDKSINLLKRAIEIDPENSRIQECYRAAEKFHNQFIDIKK